MPLAPAANTLLIKAFGQEDSGFRSMNVSSSIRVASLCFLFILAVQTTTAHLYECQPSAPNADQEQFETKNDLWPRAGSPLIGSADATLAPDLDFNGTKRSPPCDVGAYEADNHEQNIGWRIEPGFRKTNGS